MRGVEGEAVGIQALVRVQGVMRRGGGRGGEGQGEVCEGC